MNIDWSIFRNINFPFYLSSIWVSSLSGAIFTILLTWMLVEFTPGFTDKEINRRNEKALSHFGLGIPSPNMRESELCTGCNMCKWLFCINLVFLAKMQLFTGKRPPGF